MEDIVVLWDLKDYFDFMQEEGPKRQRSVCNDNSSKQMIPHHGLAETLSEIDNDTYCYGAVSSHNHSSHAVEQQPLTDAEQCQSDASSPHSFPALRVSVTFVWTQPQEPSHHHDHHHIANHLHGSGLCALVLLVALSFHSVLAGLPIGLVSDSKDIYSTAIAILAHKVFAGYALGSTIAAANVGYTVSVLMSVGFSLSTPLGILIGMSWDMSFHKDSTCVGMVQAVVSGTFLYVAIMEVGMKELLICRHNAGPLQVSLSQKQVEVLKLVSMLAGFLGMSYLAKFI